MSRCEPFVRQRTDALDAVGNTTAAMGKGFAIGSAALTALALFSTFRATAATAVEAAGGETAFDPRLLSLALDNPNVLLRHVAVYLRRSNDECRWAVGEQDD